MTILDKFNKALDYRKRLVIKTSNQVKELEDKIKNETKESYMLSYNQQLIVEKRVLRHQESFIEFMRIPKDNKDKEYRIKIKENYPNIIKNSIPDNFPIVFHGTANISTVREIIKTGGLFTPKQRGDVYTSFATLIDVTYKNNISVTCEFADSTESFMPYGAIFAFRPQDNELENVFKTGENSEVNNGVNGVNFKNQPDRLYGIITTPENTEKVKSWCKEYGLDQSKVYNHSEFVNHIKHVSNNQSLQI